MEEISGKWRLQKCKGGSKDGSRKRSHSLKPRSSFDSRDKECDCEDPLYKPSKADRRAQRQLSSSGHREFTRTAVLTKQCRTNQTIPIFRFLVYYFSARNPTPLLDFCLYNPVLMSLFQYRLKKSDLYKQPGTCF